MYCFSSREFKPQVKGEVITASFSFLFHESYDLRDDVSVRTLSDAYDEHQNGVIQSLRLLCITSRHTAGYDAS